MDYERTLADQALAITQHQQTIVSLQKNVADLNENFISCYKTMRFLEKQNESQKNIIAELNAEMRQKEEKIGQLHSSVEQKNQLILQLTQQNQSLLRSTANNLREGRSTFATIAQIRDLFVEFHAGVKRKHDDE